MNEEMKNWFSSRTQMKKQAVEIIKKHAPLLNDQQASEVAIIAMKSWQDMRSIYNYADACDFIESL